MTIEHSVFSITAGLTVEMLFMLFSVLNAMQWAKMSEYKAYWLMDFPQNNELGACQEIIMVISKKKLTNKYKENQQFYS